MNATELEDKIALKELVDKIAILGDKKDFENQVQLFSENAVSETIAKGKTILKLRGRKEMLDAFNEFHQEIETAYHFNGQQIVTINGNSTSGICYCLITLISNENGKKLKTTIGAIYEDEYIRVDSQWLVSKRIGYFNWQDKTEIKS